MQTQSADLGPYAVDLGRLRAIAKGVSRRCIGTEYEPATEWCESILAAVDGLDVGADRSASIHLLGHAALNLNQVFAPEKTQSEHLTAIDATVAIVKARILASSEKVAATG
jgi:hypothetical protein